MFNCGICGHNIFWFFCRLRWFAGNLVGLWARPREPMWGPWVSFFVIWVVRAHPELSKTSVTANSASGNLLLHFCSGCFARFGVPPCSVAGFCWGPCFRFWLPRPPVDGGWSKQEEDGWSMVEGGEDSQLGSARLGLENGLWLGSARLGSGRLGAGSARLARSRLARPCHGPWAKEKTPKRK